MVIYNTLVDWLWKKCCETEKAVDNIHYMYVVFKGFEPNVVTYDAFLINGLCEKGESEEAMNCDRLAN